MRLTVACVLAASLTACSVTSTTETGEAEVACKVFAPITYSSSGDTPETISQIKAHNRAWEAVCDQPQE
jgi:hypothetical protein